MSNRIMFDGLLRVRAPSSLEDALSRAAEAECSTVSEFVRRALLERLRQAGFSVVNASGSISESNADSKGAAQR